MSKINGIPLRDLSDEELVKICKTKNQDAIAVLYLRFKGLIYSITFDYLTKHNIAQMYRDDLIDIATDSLFKAIDTFDGQEGSSFLNFWWTICLRSFSTHFKRIVSTKLFFYEPNFFDIKIFEKNFKNFENNLEVGKYINVFGKVKVYKDKNNKTIISLIGSDSRALTSEKQEEVFDYDWLNESETEYGI